jgi:VanZ family protein
VRRKIILTLCWGVTLCYWAFMAVVTHTPQPRLPGVPVSDKTSHLIGYGTLASMLYVTLWIARPRAWSLTWKIPLILFIYGALDEVTQPMFQRSGEVADWIADAAGVLIAVGAWSCIRLVAARNTQANRV